MEVVAAGSGVPIDSAIVIKRCGAAERATLLGDHKHGDSRLIWTDPSLADARDVLVTGSGLAWGVLGE